jgi:hypothetical protein
MAGGAAAGDHPSGLIFKNFARFFSHDGKPNHQIMIPVAWTTEFDQNVV